jgi:hypothetical protein
LEKRLEEGRERKEGSISSNSWTTFTPQPFHGELKMNPPFLGFPLKA